MAELNLPSLSLEITADGSAAIQELEHTRDAAQRVSDEVNRGISGEPLDDLAESARNAGREIEGAGDAAGDAGDQIGKAAKQAKVDWKSLGDEMSKVGKGMSVAVTAPVMAAVAASVNGASDLTETLGKTEVVFGELNDRMLDWASNSVESMGLAQQTALDMASTYGDMATGMGLSQQTAAEMSTTLTQLAADLASFKNIGISDVNTALTAVFTGETESLKRLGVVMTQTNLQQFALTQGITQNVAELSQAEQVQLRYAYVMAQTANAQGDFQRTGGNLANQMRALGESVKELGNSFGQILIPVVTPVVSALREAVTAFGELDDGTKRIILAVGLAVAAVGPLLLVGGKVISMISGIQAAVAALSLNPVIIGITAAVAALTALGAALNLLKPKVDTTGDSYNKLKQSIIEGASGKVELDTSGVPDEIPVSITADGQQALNTAGEIVEKLRTDPQYAGKLAIDGDPAKADAVLAQLQADIAAVDQAVNIDGNDEAARAAMARLQADIAQLEAVVAYTDDPTTKALLMRQLSMLKSELGSLTASVNFNESPDDGLEQYKRKLEELPRDETYRNTGDFQITGAGADAINEYAEALTAAATATGNYSSAVEKMNKVVDSETQRKIEEVNAQVLAAGDQLTHQYNSGLIGDAEYQAGLERILTDGQERIKVINEEAEAQKRFNETFADGSRENDYGAFGEYLKERNKGQGVTAEEGMYAAQRRMEGTSTNEALDAQTELQGSLEESKVKYQQAAQAVLQYQQAMQEANETEEGGKYVSMEGSDQVVRAQEAIERATALKEMLTQYSIGVKSGGSPEEVLSGIVDHFGEQLQAYDGLEENLRSILTGENGQPINPVEADAKYNKLDAFIEECQQGIDEAAKEADTLRQNAAKTLADSLRQLGENYTEESAEAAIAMLESYGTKLTEEQKEMLTNTPSLIEEIAKAAETEDPGAIDAAIRKAFEGVDIEEAAKPIGEGVPQGISEAEAEAASGAFDGSAETVASANEAALRNAYQSHSPSERMKPLGKDVTDGIAEGMKDTSSLAAAAEAVAAAVQAALSTALSNAEDGAEGGSVGAALMASVAEGASSGGGLSSAVGAAIRTAVSNAGSIASSGGLSVGKNLGQGIANGINTMLSTIITAARRAVQQAVNAAKQAGDIHSPSRVMEQQVGMPLMQGMESGVTRQLPTTIQVIRESVSGVISGAAAVVKQGSLPSPALATASGVSIDYERMGESIGDAMRTRPIQFSVGARQLATVTRDEAARQQAVRVSQINAGYGGR